MKTESRPAAVDHLALVYQLGGSPRVLPVPVSGRDDLLEVGTLASLVVWSHCGTSREARNVARSLAQHGRIGLLLSRTDLSGGDLAAITMLPLRLAPLGTRPSATLPFERLRHAAHRHHATQLESAIACADALDVDAAGRQTFALLRRLLDRGVALLPGHVPRETRHAWTLMQLTRILFLRFVESEGWLDGNPRFLADGLDRCLRSRRDPTRHLLHPLFFGTLNRPQAERTRFARAFGQVPFLNGGLFEPHVIEQRHTLRLPAMYWRDVFEALVDRVDVALEADVLGGRVTPELLGRVFEGVMEVEERKQEGTFFTPPAMVDALFRAALVSHLAPRLDRSEVAIERGLDDPDPVLRRTLRDVTVLDPAVGSGAFLVGALAALHGPGPRKAVVVRHLVTRRLFGVDRHPDAVRLAELRLWLEVLRAMRGRAPDRIPPLPNLDATIRSGDALLDPLAGHPLAGGTVRVLTSAQRAINGSAGASKRRILATMRQRERTGIVAALAAREEALDREIASLLAHARQRDLFGEARRMQRADRDALRTLRHRRVELRRERRRLATDRSAVPFALEIAFAPVLARRGGFDMVVGNPPWVRAERLSPRMRQALAARYRWWRSGGQGWRHLPDLSVAFVERAHELLAPGGTQALLVPAKLVTAGYARACRDALTASATLHCVADLADDPRAGFDATTYPLACIASRRTPTPEHRVRVGLGYHAPAIPQRQWRDGEAWLLADPAVQQLASRLRKAYPALRETMSPQLGVKTGANQAFLDPPLALAPWTRRALRGRDVRAFRAEPKVRLLWPADARGAPWSELPAAMREHLTPFRTILDRRADLHDSHWWRLFRTTAATAAHRVVWGDLARSLEATTIADPEIVPINSCYVIDAGSVTKAESLTAWLNCSWIRALARLCAEPAAGGAARFGARAVGAVPLPPEVLGDPILASLTHRAASFDVSDILDNHCADLLGLSEHDRTLLLPLAAHRR